ncbi:putative FERM and PDZ domain-containing protein 4-like, partial [Apostichopus japonicus]
VSDETDTKTECEIIVNPRIGICKVEDKENEVYNQISDFKGIEALVLSRQPMVKEDTVNAVCQVELIKTDGQKFHLVTTEADGTDFSYFVSGLYKIYVNDEKNVLSIDNSKFIQDPSSGTPVYLGEHHVLPAGWNYPDVDDYPIYETEEDTDLEYLIDLTEGPPTYDSVLNRNSDELSLPRTDGSDSDEVALSFDSDDASEEPKITDDVRQQS